MMCHAAISSLLFASSLWFWYEFLSFFLRWRTFIICPLWYVALYKISPALKSFNHSLSLFWNYSRFFFTFVFAWQSIRHVSFFSTTPTMFALSSVYSNQLFFFEKFHFRRLDVSYIAWNFDKFPPPFCLFVCFEKKRKRQNFVYCFLCVSADCLCLLFVFLFTLPEISYTFILEMFDFYPRAPLFTTQEKEKTKKLFN